MKNSAPESHNRLLTEERRQRIVSLIEARGTISAEDLVAQMGVSNMTIWRDLTVLEEAGKLRRIRGGAVRVENVNALEPLYAAKRVLNRAKKDAIARYAAQNFVRDNDIIILEAGTTVAAMVKFLNQRNLTLITNGLGTVNEAAPSVPDISVMCCGGLLRAGALTFVGPQAAQFFSNIRARTFFLGGSGLAFPQGITDPSPLEIQVKQAMAASAERVVVLIDSSKFGVYSLSTILPLSSIYALVTDSGAPEETVQQLRGMGIEVHVVRP